MILAKGSMEEFSKEVRDWFKERFGDPTDVQGLAWDKISKGRNTLVIAPTGSGKTLAAFLYAIDSLMQQKARAERWKRGVRILYISPLKALGADVQRNLAEPLAGIAARTESAGDVTVGMRTGDTTPTERRRLASKPPDILITTPESLYLMLTSKAREALESIETVIVDEIHSIAGSKRGAHLSLSLERLDSYLGHAPQRVGLSATIEPVSEAAHFLGGIHPVEVVKSDEDKPFDISVRVPVEDMTSIPSFGDNESVSIWPYIESSILDEVIRHKSTIVFVNSRGMCERLTARLNELYARMSGKRSGEDAIAEMAGKPLRSDIGSTSKLVTGTDSAIAKAHHGSVSKEKRQAVESELKSGSLRCVVATSSLELGIDMGEVDLVIQVAPPLSVASGLQRIGRANHQVAGRSKALIYPRTRTETIDAAVMVESMRKRQIEHTHLVRNALDVLSQQTVAEASMHPDGLSADEWLGTVRKSANYSDLGNRAFEEVIDMLTGKFASGDVAEFAPRIAYDRKAGLLSPLPRTQRLAVTAGGTIPDRGLYPVMLPEGDSTKGRRRVGELDEEMVHESRVGDYIILGTTTWKIKEISNDRVIVDAAPGHNARLPFWHGENEGAGYEDAIRRGKLIREIQKGAEKAGLGPEACKRLGDDGFNEAAKDNLGSLLCEQRMRTKVIPDDINVVLERTVAETGEVRIIVHSSFGKRVHSAWALAIAKRAHDLFGFDPQPMAEETGILLTIPADDGECDIKRAIVMSADEADSIIRLSIGSTALFAARFRECSFRALLVSPRAPGKRAPLWQQRVKGGQLLEAARREGDFPILAEATRECLQDVYDMTGLRRALDDIGSGSVKVHEVETSTPSPFAAPLLFGYVAEHLYEGDLPHAEHSNALLSVDPGLLGELLGGDRLGEVLSEDVVLTVQSELQHLASGRQLHGSEGAYELLRQLGHLTAEQLSERMSAEQPRAQVDDVNEDDGLIEDNELVVQPLSPKDAQEILERLADDHRAFKSSIADQEVWATIEDAARLNAVLGLEVPKWAQDSIGSREGQRSLDAGDALLDGLVARVMRTNAIISLQDVAKRVWLGPALVEESLRRLAGNGRVTRISYPKGADEPKWVDTDILGRLRARSLAAARKAIEPVNASAYMRFLFQNQGIGYVGPDTGIDRLAEVISQFEGVRLPAELWEEAVFPARIPDYEPSMLDELLESGDIVWIGMRNDKGRRTVAFFPTDSPFCPMLSAKPAKDDHEALSKLLWNGMVAVDSFALVRFAKAGQSSKQEPLRKARSRRSQARYGSSSAINREVRAQVIARNAEDAAYAGHWAQVIPPDVNDTMQVLNLAESLLDLYGVITRDMAMHANIKGGLGMLYPVIRHMEDAGELLRGLFVEGMPGSQFASSNTIDELRKPSPGNEDGPSMVVLQSEDPANLLGDAIPWPQTETDLKPARRAGSRVVFQDGVPVLYATARCKDLITFTDDEDALERALIALAKEVEASQRKKPSSERIRIAVRTIDGRAAMDSSLISALKVAGFVPNGLEMRLYIKAL